MTSRTRTIYRDNVNRVKTKKRVGFVDKNLQGLFAFSRDIYNSYNEAIGYMNKEVI